MRRAIAVAAACVALLSVLSAQGQTVGFSAKPTAEKAGQTVTIRFALSATTDVEVAVVDRLGKVVRHLAAGVLGGPKPPPAPLRPGLRQELVWDGKDDFGKPVSGSAAAGLKVRVRLGTGARFGRFIGADPYNVGRVLGSAADENGNLYVLGFGGQLNQGQVCLRVFDKQGRYLRELLPFPATVARDAVKDVARWDEQARTFRPINRKNLNPDFYGLADKSLTLVSASKSKGVVLKSKSRTLVLDSISGAIRPDAAADGSGGPADLSAFDAARARLSPRGEKWTGPGERPIDWTRIAVDPERDEVYVNDGVCYVWRFDGQSGEGGLLRRDRKPFYAADVAVGYDGLLYFRKCMGYQPGVTDFSGPFERFTHDLAPAKYPGGTNVISKYIYGRYGIGYADRGIGVGPDGTAYISFMYDWVKYCTAGFGPDGKPLKGKHLEGLVGNKGDAKKGYPEELTSAVVGPIPGGNGGIRVDLQGNIYIGMWIWPKDVPVPEAFAKDEGYLTSVGSVVKFTRDGGFATSPVADWSSDPVGSTPRTPGAKGIEARSGYRTPRTAYDVFLEGAVAAYPGYAPFSHANWGGNNCCVCRVPRFDLDRYGRLAMPNAITNSVRIVDNSGNLVAEIGRYGNFDSQFVPPNAAGSPPIAGTPDIPLAWPTGAGVTEKSVYILDTYSRRVVRADLTWKAEESCPVR